VKQETQFPIAREGFPFIGCGALLTLFAKAVLGDGWVAFFALLTLFCTWFFRDPHRVVPEGDGLLVSPADGVIVDISKIYDEQVIKGPAIRVSIFLNVFNVHITRVPVEGRVVDISYNPGRFFAANVPKASLENEQNSVILETPWGKKVIVTQIAGFIARRIVCWIKKGAVMNCGERFGLIRFGSRVDIVFPVGVALRVSKGDRVCGGQTILGKLT
jgi:phosphatidylserine decarboxylase